MWKCTERRSVAEADGGCRNVPYTVHFGVATTYLPVKFFRTAVGSEPVREWLKSLAEEERRVIGQDLWVLQEGWPIGMPLCRNLGQGLWEMRSDLPGRKIARVLFCIHDGAIGLLHGFIKKTRKTPKSDLELARNRKRELENA